MGKKKKQKALKVKQKHSFKNLGDKRSGHLKSKCCKKYKKCETKRCKKCPCFDVLQKVA